MFQLRLRAARAVASSVMTSVVIVIVVAAGLGYYAFITIAPSKRTSSGSSSTGPSAITSSSTAGSSTQVSYSGSSSQASGSTQSVCGTAAKGTKTVSVSMFAGGNHQFSPQAVTVLIGVNNTLMWTNDDMSGDMRSVTSRTGAFDSGDMGLGQTFMCVFTASGTYDYYSRYNPAMVGTVIVKSP